MTEAETWATPLNEAEWHAMIAEAFIAQFRPGLTEEQRAEAAERWVRLERILEA